MYDPNTAARAALALVALGVLSGVGLNGCTAWQANETHRYDLYIGGGFTSEQHVLVVEAANRWSEATAGFVTFGLVGHAGDPTTIEIDGVSASELFAVCGNAHVCGDAVANGEATHIYIGNYVGGLFETVVEHELGHALGLQHDASGSVMCASSDCASSQITCEDAKQLCRVWGCDVSQMPVCAPPDETPAYCDVRTATGATTGMQCGANDVYWTWKDARGATRSCREPCTVGAVCDVHHVSGVCAH